MIQGEFPFLEDEKHVISIVGAGGKTTLLYYLGEQFAARGMRTILTTTTHICEPEGDVFAENPEEVLCLWNRASYAVVGVPCGEGKLTVLPQKELDAYIRMADVVIMEADGAKKMPCKVPAEHEPVITKECDIVIGVMGMDTFGRPLGQVCFRTEEAIRLLDGKAEDIMNAEQMAKILASCGGTRKNVGDREYYVVLNKCDSKKRILAAEQIRGLLEKQGIDRCVLTSFWRNRWTDE